MKLTQRELAQYSLHRLFAGERNIEVEISEQLAHDAGREHVANAPSIPWAVLAQRDMTAAGVSGSGNLVGVTTSEPLAALLPFSVVARLGVQVMDGLTNDVAIPSCTTNVASYWLADETTVITEGQPTVGTIQLTPKRCGSRIEYTRQLRQQSSVDAYLRRLLLQGMGQALDAALLGGTGLAGQPTGITAWTGVGAVAGASFDWADAVAMLEGVAAGDDDRIAFVGTAAVRELLQAREIGTLGSGLIWQDRKIAGYPARVSANVAAGTLIVGDFSNALVAFWGQPQVLIDPFYGVGFTTGKVAVRSLMMVDTAILRPETFAYSSSIT